MFWFFMKISNAITSSASQMDVTVNIWEHNLTNWGLIISGYFNMPPTYSDKMICADSNSNYCMYTLP